MLQKCKAVVLRTIKYSENSFIINCYTDTFGRISFIVSGLRSKKSKNKIALFQTLSLLELEVYYKDKREVQRIKEVHVSIPFISLSSDIFKSSISFFLAEVMFKTLKEHENNFALFNFIENSIIALDLLKKNKQISNFHLAFLLQFSKYLGFAPLDNYSDLNKCFNLLKGKFVNCNQTSSLLASTSTSINLSHFIKNGYNNTLLLNRNQRVELLNTVIEYFNFHLDTKLKIKSLEVLTEIFE